MQKNFGATQLFILVGLVTLILAPRPIAGALNLRTAARLDAAGNKTDAALAYATAAARIPWMPVLWEQAGRTAMDGGEAGNAISYFNKAADRHAITSSGWLSLGSAYQEQGQVSQAINAWKQALPLARADSFLAAAERSRGNFTEAIAYWRANITLEPESSAAHYSLGLLLAATAPGQANPELIRAVDLCTALEAPVQSLRTALNTAFLSDDRGYQFLVSGQALGALGEWDLAAEAFRNATISRPVYGEAWAWLRGLLHPEGMYVLSSRILGGAIALGILVAVAAVGVFVNEKYRLRRRALRIGLDALPDSDKLRLARQLAFYDQFLQLLGRHKITRPRSLTPREFAQSLTFLPARAYEQVCQLTEVFYRVRFGKHDLSPARQRLLMNVIQDLARLLAGPSPRDG